MSGLPAGLGDEQYAYLTTTGRVSGRPHEIEIWFAAGDRGLYLISGNRDRSDWVRNLLASPRALVRVGERRFPVTARLALDDPAERRAAAEGLHAKYGAYTTSSVDSWADDGYLVALDLDGDPADG